MIVLKCDLCKKEMGYNEKIGVTFANYNHKNADLCESCALPILKFLEKSKLFKKDEKEIKKS
jgi:hypothetical protein